jgi:hypothetical protein
MLGLHFWQRIKRGMGTVWFRSLIWFFIWGILTSQIRYVYTLYT